MKLWLTYKVNKTSIPFSSTIADDNSESWQNCSRVQTICHLSPMDELLSKTLEHNMDFSIFHQQLQKYQRLKFYLINLLMPWWIFIFLWHCLTPENERKILADNLKRFVIFYVKILVLDLNKRTLTYFEITKEVLETKDKSWSKLMDFSNFSDGKSPLRSKNKTQSLFKNRIIINLYIKVDNCLFTIVVKLRRANVTISFFFKFNNVGMLWKVRQNRCSSP